MVVQNNTSYSSIKIFLESRKANVSLNTARKIWSLNKPIVIPNGAPIKMLCSIESASIPLSYYTINETNQNFSLLAGGIEKIGKVPVGNYTIKTLITALNDALAKIFDGVGLYFKYDTAKSKVIIEFDTGVNNQVVNTPKNLYRLLGLEVSQNLPATYIAPNCVSLVYTSGIYISLNNVENSNIDTGTFSQCSNVLLRMPISQPVNTYLQYFNAVGFKTMLNAHVLSSLDISLLDDNRNLLQLTANVDWSIVMRIDFEKTVDDSYEDTKINRLRGS